MCLNGFIMIEAIVLVCYIGSLCFPLSVVHKVEVVFMLYKKTYLRIFAFDPSVCKSNS